MYFYGHQGSSQGLDYLMDSLKVVFILGLSNNLWSIEGYFWSDTLNVERNWQFTFATPNEHVLSMLIFKA